MPLRGVLSSLLTAAIVAGSGQLTAAAAAPISPASHDVQVTAATAPPTRSVSYGGVTLRVPPSWRVIDLDRTPSACVRLDVSTVYLGAAAAQQDCPAHLVGRADTVWLAPAAARTARVNGRIGAVRADIAADPSSGSQIAAVADRDVVVQATWGSSRTAVDQVLATMAATTGSVAPADRSAASTNPSSAPSFSGGVDRVGARVPADARPATAAAPSTDVFTGLGIDTCAAPSLKTMNAWKSSRFRAAGIYIGGSQRACGDGNLSASWVTSVSAAGWGLIPIYVGLQAPCVTNRGPRTISPSSASSQGAAAATDAVAKARHFAIAPGRTLYYDMEDYGSSPTCRATVLSFMSSWTAALHRSGYRSGVYGGPQSMMSDMSRAGRGFVAPDDVWIAYWNGIADNLVQSKFPDFPDTKWAGHQRMHQYAGNITETWGGVRLQFDANWIDTRLSGRATPVGYGNRVTGPVGAGFRWTGPMSSWHSMAGQGLRGQASWTGSSGTSREINGASWSVDLIPGTYRAMAYLPASNSTARVRYTITGPGVSTSSVITQAGTKGYRPVTTFTVRAAGRVVAHLADNAGSPAGTRLAADALWFQPIGSPAATVPRGVRQVSGTVADSSSTVRWTASASGAAPTAYTVTASPGGRSVTVRAAARTATITGLKNGMSYRFTVVAKNSGGAGPAVASAAVVPTPATRLTAVTPVRLLDTRRGTSYNPVRRALAPGASMTVAVSGLRGSPVPSWATGVQLQVTVESSRSGWLTTPSAPVTFGASLVSSTSRLFPLTRHKVTFVNHGKASVQVLIDVQAFASRAGDRWTVTPQTRLVDTRHGSASNARIGAIPAGGTVRLRIAGAPGSPVRSGTTAALLNLTAAAPRAAGYLTVNGATGTSVLNFGPRATVAGTALIRLQRDGTITVTNRSPMALQLLVDVQAYGGGSPAYQGEWTQVPQTRVLSSAAGTAVHPQRFQLAADRSISVRVRDTYGTPLPSRAKGVQVAMSVGPVGGSGSLAGGASGAASLFEFGPGGPVSNTALMPIAANGTLTFTNRSSTTLTLIVDVSAYLS